MSEQDIFRTELERMGEFGDGNKHLLMVPQYKLNAYPDEIGCREDRSRPWKEGDWIIHFPVHSLKLSVLLLLIVEGCLGCFKGP